MNDINKKPPSPKVLFVDDEENILRALTRLLMDEPYEVLTAKSGKEGLGILKQNPDVGLIVSDQRMPEMNGVEFLARSRELAPDALRMVLTGYADITAAVDAINKGGAYRYVGKPWKDDELVQVIREGVSRHALETENRRLTEVVRRQNEELKKWSAELEEMVQRQTLDLQNQSKTLAALNDRLRKNFTDTLTAFSGLLELRDRSAGSHSRSVSELAGAMARAQGLPPEETGTIIVAALLHDIGKIGVSDAVLAEKIDEMPPEDRTQYMTHPVRGQAAIDAVEDLRRASLLIRHHHERWDGTGFPDRLSGASIPLGSRIISMADYFDRAVGSFRGEEAAESALAAVKWNVGKRFDPELLPALERCIGGIRSKYLNRTDVLELEMKPAELKEGMVLTRDVRSGTGLLLLSAGAELSAKSIQALIRYFQIDPPKGNVFVLLKR